MTWLTCFSSFNIKKDEIKITGYFDEELIGLDVVTDHIIGKVKEIQNGFQKLIVVEGKKEYLIPYVDAFIKKIDSAVEQAIKHEEWRTEYMTLLMRDKEKK